MLAADQALSGHPGDCKLLSLKAVALGNLGQPKPALLSFEKALMKCPTYLPALEGAAHITYTAEDPHASALLSRILTLDPTNLPAHAMLALLLSRQSDCSPSLPHFKVSQPLFPQRPDLQQQYAMCLFEVNDLKGALAQYYALMATSPNDTVRYDAAFLQWKTHADQDALATLSPLLEAHNNAAALALASRIHEENGETPQAVDLLRSAILVAPEKEDNYLQFSELAFNHKSFQVGVDMLDAGITRMPEAASLYLARGVLEVQLSHDDAGLADFRRAHQLNPKLSFAEDALGMMQSQQHQGVESLAFFRAQARLHPDDPFLFYLLAEQFSQHAEATGNNTLNEAIDAAKQATSLDPHLQAAHDLLAVLYVRENQPSLAINEAELALAEDPDDQAALYQEILARRRSGDTAKLPSLLARLHEVREANQEKQQSIDRYQLQDQLQR